MASIRKRVKKNGSITYYAEIFIKRQGVIRHREGRSFDRLKLAKAWSARRELELSEMEVFNKPKVIPIKDIISQYLDDFPPTGRTKNFDLNKLMICDICNIDIHQLTTKDLIRHIIERNKTVSPQTANNDLVWLKVAIQTMRSVMGFKFDMSIFDDARTILRQERKIARSNKRDRLPTSTELLRLSRYLDDKTRVCMWFAIYSTRRLSEITRLQWTDVNFEDRTVLVRDLKNPRIKGLSRTAKIPKSAFKIITKQAKTSDRIFPYNPKTIGTYFSQACKMLGINNLHFHDMRHCGLTYYASKGLSLSELRLISLHQDYSSLQRYINLNPKDLDV